MIDMSDENQQYYFGDVINRMKTTKAHQDLPIDEVCARVIKTYLQMVFTAILKGFVVELPCKFGTFFIQKKEVKKGTKYYDEFQERTGKAIQLNMKRIGFKYEFVLHSPVLKKFCYRIRVADPYRKELQKILTHTDFDYRTNLI